MSFQFGSSNQFYLHFAGGHPMNRRAVFCVLGVLFASGVYAGNGTIVRDANRVNGVYIAWLTSTAPGTPAAKADDIARETGGTLRHTFHHLNGFSFRGNDAIAAAVSRDPRVRAVTEVGTAHVTGSGSQSAPSWGLDRIDQLSYPLNGLYTWPYSGNNVVVYVIDSGVNTIADLGTRVIRQENFVSGDPQTGDCLNHGTSVAEIIAGTTYGVAKSAKIVSLRAFDCNGNGMADDIDAAIDRMCGLHASVQNELAVANFSWIRYSVYFNHDFIDPYQDQIVMSAITDFGITVVTAAGDWNGNACGNSPAHLGDPSQYYPNPSGASTITVAGSQKLSGPGSDYDAISDTTNQGTCVSIFAPSIDIATLDNVGNARSFSGTSAAVPHVAGVAALFLEKTQLANNPNAIQNLIKQSAIANQLHNGLTSQLRGDTFNLLVSTVGLQ
jgi:subtilisin family serine protease